MQKNRIVKAFLQAMDLCYEKDPTKRGTSIEVARILHKAMKLEQEKKKEKEKKKAEQ
jgi:hypothetical protein